MTFDHIIKDINTGVIHPIYFLYGDEEYFIDAITKTLENNILREEEKAFNQTILYGKEVDAKNLLPHLYRLPMNASYNVVILKEGQMVRDLFSKIMPYLSQPATNTVFIINYKSKQVDNRKKAVKELKTKAVFYESKKLYDSQLPQFIVNYLSDRQKTIDPKATQLIVEYLGNDLSKVVKELDKLLINLGENDKMSYASVSEFIGVSRDYNSFELNKYLGQRNHDKAIEIIIYMTQNLSKFAFPLIIRAISHYFINILKYHYSKGMSEQSVASLLGVHPFFIKEYRLASKQYNIRKVVHTIDLIYIYDQKLKGVNNGFSVEELLKELIIKILESEEAR